MTEGAFQDVTAVDAPVVAVTVFTDGARVQRAGTVNLGPGPRTVVIGDLPDTVDAASVRVTARGQDLALINVEVHREFHAEPVRDETARLRAEVDRLRDAVSALDDSDAAERAGLDFLGHLSGAAASAFARAVSFGRLGQDELDRMAGHLTAGTADALGRRREISARTRAAAREVEAAENQLAIAEMKAENSSATVSVSAALEARSATDTTVELSYHVTGASWRPLYDLVLDGDRLAVNYLAEVTQQTGEDWPEAELTLSTTRRGAHQTLPELTPWYIGPARPPRPAMAMKTMRARAGGDTDEPVAYAAAASVGAPQPEAAPILAAAGDSSTGLVYRVQRPMSVPSDGEPHKTTVTRLDLDAALDYLTVPALASEAYLRATVTNTSEMLLLPGVARAFRGTTYVGETWLETVAGGEEFELQLGVDDQVRVTRELRRRHASKAILGGTRTVDVGYEITIANHLPGPARVTVKDHFPVSTDGAVKVRLRDSSPAPEEQTDLGELAWNLSLRGGESAKLQYRFTVEHPGDITVSGL
jgi:uncharacterized protein (TIGR02231 family)